MKILASVLIGVLALPTVSFAQGPIAESAARQYKDNKTPTGFYYEEDMKHPMIFWAGAGLAGIGVLGALAAVTTRRDSDLSEEDPNTRLGRDLAPCGTSPKRTPLPIADCKVNAPLLTIGIVSASAGVLMMVYGGRRVCVSAVCPEVEVGARSVALRLKF
jgi:hypothetical protein